MQLLRTYFTLNKECEMSEWRDVRMKENNLPFGEHFQELVRSRWDHAC